MKLFAPLHNPLNGVGIFFFLIALKVVEHLFQSVDLIAGSYRVKKKRLVVARIDRDEVQFGPAIECGVLKHQIRRLQAEVIPDFLLNSCGFYSIAMGVGNAVT